MKVDEVGREEVEDRGTSWVGVLLRWVEGGGEVRGGLVRGEVRCCCFKALVCVGGGVLRLIREL